MLGNSKALLGLYIFSQLTMITRNISLASFNKLRSLSEIMNKLGCFLCLSYSETLVFDFC